MRRVLVLLAAAALLAAAHAAEDNGAASKTLAAAASDEAAAYTALVSPLRRWEADKLGELSRAITSLPEPAALRAVWMMAAAPPRVDTTPILAAALSARWPEVRAAAADVLVAAGGQDSRRLLFSVLATDGDAEVIRHIVTSLAMQPTERSALPATSRPTGIQPNSRAVRNMIDIMFESNLKSPAVETAAAELRRLTRANLSDNPADWRDWWLDNELNYAGN